MCRPITSPLGTALLLTLLLVLCSFQAHARDIRIAMPSLPNLVEINEEGQPFGVFVDLVKAMNEEYSDGYISLAVLPFVRAKEYVGRKADALFPYAWTSPMPLTNEYYRYSTATVYHAKFYLYYNIELPLTPAQARSGRYRLETQSPLRDVYPFVTEESISLESSLKKLAWRRIDGFIFAAQSANRTLEALERAGWKYKGCIASVPFNVQEVKFLLPPDDKGRELDDILSRIIEKLQASGKLKVILAPLTTYYDSIP